MVMVRLSRSNNDGGCAGRRVVLYFLSNGCHFRDRALSSNSSCIRTTTDTITTTTFTSLIRFSMHRGFFSGAANLLHPNLVKQSNLGLSCGALLYDRLGAIRSIHSGPESTSLDARDYYDLLGVCKSANSDEIKKSYYGLAMKLHPDTNRDDPDAEKKFHRVQKAYEVLKDAEKRSMYDQVGHDAFDGAADGTNAGMEDIIRDIFEREFGGQDVQVPLELSFMEAIQGCSKMLSFQTALPCEACDGTGVPPGTRPETCKACKGAGMIFMQGAFRSVACMRCGGTGKTAKNYCKSCKGVRVMKGSKTVKIDVPPGTDNNDILKMSRCGGMDPEGNHRNLHVAIKVKEDPVFRREGVNIHVDAVLSHSQANLGGTIKVPTLTGDVVLKVRPGTQPGQKVVLKKKGIKTRSSAKFGDHYVHFNVVTPTNSTDRQGMLSEESTEEQGENDGAAATAAYG